MSTAHDEGGASLALWSTGFKGMARFHQITGMRFSAKERSVGTGSRGMKPSEVSLGKGGLMAVIGEGATDCPLFSSEVFGRSWIGATDICGAAHACLCHCSRVLVA